MCCSLLIKYMKWQQIVLKQQIERYDFNILLDYENKPKVKDNVEDSIISLYRSKLRIHIQY